MKIILIITLSFWIVWGENIILTQKDSFTILSNIHLVNEVAYKTQNRYQALIEIPAGTTDKWEVNHISGHIEWEFKNNKPRKISFLPYPGNYGFIPQTILDKNDGGDGDPLDVIVLGSSVSRATTQDIKIIGAIKLLDEGEHDDKIIAVPTDGVFSSINSLEEMMFKFPGSIQIIRFWFEGYDQRTIQFMGYMKKNQAEQLIEKAHIIWSQQVHEK
jgi:inorganic pyrophosphatase